MSVQEPSGQVSPHTLNPKPQTGTTDVDEEFNDIKGAVKHSESVSPAARTRPTPYPPTCPASTLSVQEANSPAEAAGSCRCAFGGAGMRHRACRQIVQRPRAGQSPNYDAPLSSLEASCHCANLGRRNEAPRTWTEHLACSGMLCSSARGGSITPCASAPLPRHSSIAPWVPSVNTLDGLLVYSARCQTLAWLHGEVAPHSQQASWCSIAPDLALLCSRGHVPQVLRILVC